MRLQSVVEVVGPGMLVGRSELALREVEGLLVVAVVGRPFAG